MGEASVSRRQRAYEPRAPLVNQVDADELDDGVVEMLVDGVEKAVCRFKPNIDIKPELTLLLKLLVFGAGVLGPTNSSPGAAMQNLRLISSRGPKRPSRRTLLLYLLLHPPLFPSYVLTRVRQTALSRQWPDLPSHDWRRKAWKLLVRLETLARAWELAGWALFLWDGLAPSLLMRILHLRFAPTAPRLARMVSYEFMNRQLVWGVMTEFLMFAVPRIPSLPPALNPATALAPVRQFLSQPTQIDYAALSASAGELSAARKAGTAAPSSAHSGPFARLPASVCPVCYVRRTEQPQALSGTDIELPSLDNAETEDEDKIFVPAQTDCWGQCMYCYYCVADELARAGRRFQKGEQESSVWSCLRCGGEVTRAWRATAKETGFVPPADGGDGGDGEKSSDSDSTPTSEKMGESYVVVD